LSNIRTSTRYQRFMSRLATLRSIKDLQEENFYAPLLDANNPDKCGQYAYVWQNSVYQGEKKNTSKINLNEQRFSFIFSFVSRSIDDSKYAS
jgi:hypothetical protein